MKLFLNLILLNMCYNLSFINAMHPEVNLNFEQRVKRHGYPLEVHTITTEDDYMIDLLRIPRGISKSSNESKNKSVILIMHGNGGSPHNFITLGRKVAPAYYFADRGFDVWLICGRGVHCVTSKKHKKYDWNKDSEYWNFSFHEIGLYDVAAGINFVTNTTNQKKIFYIGHSAGVNEIYALMSERPEFNEKIKIVTNYAGSPILTQMDYPALETIIELAHVFRGLAKLLNLYELVSAPVAEVGNSLVKHMCADPKFKRACKAAIWCFGSHVSTLIEDNVVEIIASGAPPRFSMKALIHLMDNVKNAAFRQYDYGAKLNKKIYGQPLPKEYNISACTAPSAFFSGATDSIVLKEEMWKTQELLSNTILDYEVGPSFVHLDFIFAKNATFLLYEPTLKLFKDFDAGKIPPRILRKRNV
ncbi:lipase 3-like isoform X2 [Sitophilus oryzae]|uniref:Lipase n=1 Tax=Sitophilus oryzae TaxID=7048 RepID=A0A6J2YRE7_SITOR|nr:lipase 3-like isoform X1 [Sitophilus oryzae]XP_030765355.1 lipase 3-like isoform X2 [Sitophilus oryzae]